MKIRFIIGISFLLLQLSLVIYSRFTPERFFCWAPYDEHTFYEITVTINSEALSKEEIQNRYGLIAKGWEPRSINNIFSMIDQYESTYGKSDNALVTVKYSTNGHEEKLWRVLK